MNKYHRIEPDLITAKALYPKILTRLQSFETFVDNSQALNKETFDTAYQQMADELHELTGKDMSRFLLWEWWEANGIEFLAFEIALPDPQPITDMNKDELTEIVSHIKTNNDFCENKDCDDWQYLTQYFTDRYYHRLLKLSFPKSYDYGYFCSHIIEDNYVEFKTDDIVECIYSKKPFQSQSKKLFTKYGEK